MKEVQTVLNHSKPNINEVDKFENTAIMYAAENGREDLVELLINKGADPHIITWNHKTALREAIKGGHKKIIKLFLVTNSPLKKQSIDCALIEAAQKGDKDIAKLLLEKGANPHIENIYGDTALKLAKAKGYKDIVQLIK